MTIEDMKNKFIEAFVNDGGNSNSKASMQGYYVGITDDLERRAKEHNATFIYYAKAKTKDLAIELEDILSELGFDNGDRPGNGTKDDRCNIYIYKKTKDTKDHVIN